MKALYPLKQINKKPALWVEVEAIDTKTTFGRKMSLIIPVSGTGQTWVDSDQIKIVK